jgi:hypothetical protein
MITLSLAPVASTSSFADFANPAQLRQIFLRQVGNPMAAGYDRVSSREFSNKLLANCDLIARKVKQGTYRLTPYRELLLPKSASVPPRCISVPTIRDRLLLAALKEYLHLVAPVGVPRSLPSEHVRNLIAFLDTQPAQDLRVLRLDIESCFPSVPHAPLLDCLAHLVDSQDAISMIAQALATPTLPIGTARSTRMRRVTSRGIPQGLPVSNYLAHAYLLQFDHAARHRALFYTRFVDDILALVSASQVDPFLEFVNDELRTLGLRLNEEKTIVAGAYERFDFLGYSIEWPSIGPRAVNQQRFLDSIARLFKSYRHGVTQKKLPKGMSTSARKAAFLEDLNERITGATSGRRRYGWIFYFSELNDLGLLRRLDRVIARFFERLPDHRSGPPKGLKRMVRAHYESRYSPQGGYIVDYNRFTSIRDKAQYLLKRGEVTLKGLRRLSAADIEELFAAARNRRLAELEHDVSFIY